MLEVGWMSGSTVVYKISEYYLIQMETPRISFYPNSLPDPGKKNMAEMNFHAEAQRDFETYIQKVTPELNAVMTSIITTDNNKYHIERYSDDVRRHYMDDYTNQLHYPGLSDAPVDARVRVWIDVDWGLTLDLTFSAIPSKEMLSELREKLYQFFQEIKSG